MTEYDRAMKEGRYIDAVLALSNDSTMPMKNAMIHIDAAINDLEAMNNYGIKVGAIQKLRKIYDWLEATATVLDGLSERNEKQEGEK